MHKLVFEEDVLPDGTEVAYYSRGQVVATVVADLFLVHSVQICLFLSFHISLCRNCWLDTRRGFVYFVLAAILR